MRKILEELYHGNINPNAKQFIRGTQFDKAMHTVSANEEKLMKLLDGNEKELFLEFVNAYAEVDGIQNVECFISGFRLGAKMVLEIMSDEDSCLVDID